MTTTISSYTFPRPAVVMSRHLRLLAGLLTALSALFWMAEPAAAHGGDDDDVSNYRTNPPEGRSAGVRWQVLGGDKWLEVENLSGGELIVLGYEAEPYLRFSPDGSVFANQRSPAYTLNKDRYGGVPVPPSADAKAAPEWVVVGVGGKHSWHDHRIHWMAPLPPEASAGEIEVLSWSVPYVIDQRTEQVTSTLLYLAPANPWVIFAGAALVVTAPLLVIGLRRRTIDPDLAARIVAIEALTLAALNVVRVLDDITAVRTTWLEGTGTALLAALWITIATVAAVRVLKQRRAGHGYTSIAALPLILCLGLTAKGALEASYLVSSLPASFARFTVAATIALVVPMMIALSRIEGRYLDELRIGKACPRNVNREPGRAARDPG